MTPESRSGLFPVAAKPVDVDAIERELGQLWPAAAGQPGAPESAETVTRAVMSNLIIHRAAGIDAQASAEEIWAIVQQHPARVILLIEDAADPSDTIQASVSALCHLVGGGRQVCSEHVTVQASGRATRRLPSATRALLIGDLPTALWWSTNQAPPSGGTLFRELATMADQVIYDSLGWPDPVGAMLQTVSWALGHEAGQIVSDLEWRRLKPWRRLVSQALDPRVMPGALDAITQVTFEHGPHALSQAWLLSGWLASRLGWKASAGKVKPGETVTWQFQTRHGALPVTARRLPEGEAVVKRLTIRWRADGGDASATFSSLGHERLGVALEGSTAPPRIITVPSRTRAQLVASQLADRARDETFRSTLQVARTMAVALK